MGNSRLLVAISGADDLVSQGDEARAIRVFDDGLMVVPMTLCLRETRHITYSSILSPTSKCR